MHKLADKYMINSCSPHVGEAKAEVRVLGTREVLQALYRVGVRADGKAVRVDDAEPEQLKDDTGCVTIPFSGIFLRLCHGISEV
jgi:hypothetical protein